MTKVKPPTPTLLQTIISKPLNLPGFSDVPPIDISPMTGITISQAASGTATGWTPVYRGLYSTQTEDEDIDILEQELPAWVLEFLLSNKIGGVVGGGGSPNGQKFSFMVIPWKGSESSEELPDLLSNESRLTASRWLRVRKILSYVSVSNHDCSTIFISITKVKDKVDSIDQAERRREAELQLVGENEPLVPTSPPRSSSSKSIKSTSRSSYDSPGSSRPPAGRVVAPSPGTVTSTLPSTTNHPSRNRPTSTSSSRSANSAHRNRKLSRSTIEEENTTRKRPEDLYELLCHGMLLPNEMTLAAVKKFRWKESGELVMEYRRKRA